MDDVGLALQQGSKLFLMVKGHDAYYIVTVNNALTYERELELGNPEHCRPDVLNGMGLKYRMLGRAALRGIALDDCGDCPILYLYPSEGKREKYMLSDDYSADVLNKFFFGVPRFSPPAGNRKKQRDPQEALNRWRREQQKPEVMKRMRFIPVILILLCIAGLFLFIRFRRDIGFLCLSAVPLISIALDIFLPAYFTLTDPFHGKKKRSKTAINLSLLSTIAVLLPVFVVRLNYTNAAFGKLFLLAAVLTAGLGIILMLFAEEFRRVRQNLWILLIAVVLIALHLGVANIVFDRSQPLTEEGTVEQLSIDTGSHGEDYVCTVLQENGKQLDVTIHPNLYDQLEIGDSVVLQIYPGTLGIEFYDIAVIE